MYVGHAFESAIADDPASAAAGEVLPSHWNAAHTIHGFYNTLTDAAAADIPAAVQHVTTAGYSAVGDDGGGGYKRLAAHPYTLWASGDFTPGSERRNASGNLYRLTTRPVGGVGTLTNSVQPTHLSGETVGADGFGWTFIAQSTRYFRSADRYTSAEVWDTTNGGYWSLVPTGGVVRIEQLGGVADWNGSTGTDNYTAIMAAVNWIMFDPAANTAQEIAPILELGYGKYKVGQTVHVTNVVNIRGKVGHLPDPFGLGGATQLHFTNTSGSMFVFYGNNAGNGGETGGPWGAGQNTGAASSSRIADFTCHNSSGVTTRDLTRHGINYRCAMTAERIGVYSTAGHGHYIHGQAGHGGEHEGNCNGWELISCFGHECRGHFLKIEGADANGGTSWKFTTHGTVGLGGCGIYEGPTLGNTHIQPQITGYGNMGVSHLSKQYQYLGGDSTTTPGTNDLIWHYIRDGGVTSSFPAWNSANDYSLFTLPILCLSSQTRIVGPYVEGGNVNSHSLGIVDGGVAPFTRYTPGPNTSQSVAYGAVTCGTGFGSFYTFADQTGVANTQNGSSTWTRFGGSHITAQFDTGGGAAFLTYLRQTDGDSSHYWGYAYPDIVHINQSGRYWWVQTTSETTEEFGRGSAQPNYLRFNAFGIGGQDNADQARIIGYHNGKPSSGVHALGEVWFQTNPTGHGAAAYVCKTTGTPGSYCTIPVFGLSSIEPQNDGDCVLENTSNTQLKLKYQGSDSTDRQIDFGLSTTGEVASRPATAPAAGGTLFYRAGSTAALGIYFGSGAPTASAAQGSLYMRTDGSSTSTRAYVNTDGGTTWTAVTTAA
jgi:hypothetical protein